MYDDPSGHFSITSIYRDMVEFTSQYIQSIVDEANEHEAQVNSYAEKMAELADSAKFVKQCKYTDINFLGLDYLPENVVFNNETSQFMVFDTVKEAQTYRSYQSAYANAKYQRLSFYGHMTLDTLGLVPVFGAGFDAINAIWYAAEGDNFNAFISGLSAFIDVAATLKLFEKTGSKLASVILKNSDETADAAKVLFKNSDEVAEALFKNSDEAAETLLKNSDEVAETLLKNSDEIADSVKAPAKNAAEVAEDAAKACDPACFIAGTMVLTDDGLKAIEEIQVGDIVIATDPETGETDEKKVVETYVNETEELIHVWVDGEEIITTPTHPFYVPEKGWTSAVELKAGDQLQLVNGEYVVIEAVEHELLEELVKVYNFQVEDFHTYYVGTGVSLLVHNTCPKVFKNEPVEWKATDKKGTQQTYQVYQRTDIDWDKVRTSGNKRYIGKTNAEAAKHGLAPQLDDGNFATLHHLGQDSRGGLVEASTRYHGVGKYGQDILHSQYGTNKPNPKYPIDRKKFARDNKEYWKWREKNR